VSEASWTGRVATRDDPPRESIDSRAHRDGRQTTGSDRRSTARY